MASFSVSPETPNATSAIFVENDTFSFVVGTPEIMDGWNDILPQFNQGATGIIIFPYYEAYGKKQIGSIPPFSTLVYHFRTLDDDIFVENTSLFYEFILNADTITNYTNNNVFYVVHQF